MGLKCGDENLRSKEKYIGIIYKLVEQGISKAKVDRYIIALQKNYFSDDHIYNCLKIFLDEEFECNIKNPNLSLDMSIELSESYSIYPTNSGIKNFSKNNPIYTEYIANFK